MRKFLLIFILLFCGCKGNSVFGTWEIKYSDNFRIKYTVQMVEKKDTFGSKVEIRVVENSYFFKELRSTKEHSAVFIEENKLRLVSDSLFIYNTSSDTVCIRKDEEIGKNYEAIRIK